MYRIFLHPRALKQLEKLGRKDQARVVDATKVLEADPFIGKKLRGEQDGKWSIRVWPYRILYIIDKKIITVTVLAIGHRRDVYEKM